MWGGFHCLRRFFFFFSNYLTLSSGLLDGQRVWIKINNFYTDIYVPDEPSCRSCNKTEAEDISKVK
jgi:hypothetical protein